MSDISSSQEFGHKPGRKLDSVTSLLIMFGLCSIIYALYLGGRVYGRQPVEMPFVGVGKGYASISTVSPEQFNTRALGLYKLKSSISSKLEGLKRRKDYTGIMVILLDAFVALLAAHFRIEIKDKAPKYDEKTPKWQAGSLTILLMLSAVSAAISLSCNTDIESYTEAKMTLRAHLETAKGQWQTEDKKAKEKAYNDLLEYFEEFKHLQ